MRIADYSVTKAVLERHGFTFKKSFGQNFLTDTNILQNFWKSDILNRNADKGIGANVPILPFLKSLVYTTLPRTFEMN